MHPPPSNLRAAALSDNPGYRQHELSYNENGEIIGDGSARGVHSTTLPVCTDVDVETYDLIFNETCMRIISGSMTESEQREVTATQKTIIVPPFLRRNDQIVYSLIYFERRQDLRISLDFRALLSLAMQQVQPEAHFVRCSAEDFMAEAAAAAATGQQRLCPFVGAIKSILNGAFPSLLHYNGPSKYTLAEGPFAMHKTKEYFFNYTMLPRQAKGQALGAFKLTVFKGKRELPPEQVHKILDFCGIR
jgi:hypothetical protein